MLYLLILKIQNDIFLVLHRLNEIIRLYKYVSLQGFLFTHSLGSLSNLATPKLIRYRLKSCEVHNILYNLAKNKFIKHTIVKTYYFDAGGVHD